LALIDKVKRTGQPILVTKRGEPIVLITPPPEPKRPATWLGSYRGKGQIVGDIVSSASDETQREVLQE
jgi:antitoxin (DNA-binding transcriptional repressor) of toxin-antitoxin stability system